MRRWRALRIVKFVTIGLLAVAAFSAVVMALWNTLMPVLFGLKMLSFWQALGLLLLSRLLFGRFGRPGGGAGWRAGMARWSQMTPQEREQLRARWRQHGCWGMRGEQSTDGSVPPAA